MILSLLTVDFFGGDTVHQGHGGHALGWEHPPSRQLAHPGEETLPVGERVLLEGDDPQPGSGEGHYYLPEPPVKEMAAMRVLEAPHSLLEPRGCQYAPGLRDIVAHAFPEEPWFSTGSIRVRAVPLLVEHFCCRMEGN